MTYLLLAISVGLFARGVAYAHDSSDTLYRKIDPARHQSERSAIIICCILCLVASAVASVQAFRIYH